MDDINIPLATAPRELSELTGVPVSYSRLYKAVLDGAVPAHRVGSRWHVKRHDFPTICSALGLTLAKSAKATATKPQPASAGAA